MAAAGTLTATVTLTIALTVSATNTTSVTPTNTKLILWLPLYSSISKTVTMVWLRADLLGHELVLALVIHGPQGLCQPRAVSG